MQAAGVSTPGVGESPGVVAGCVTCDAGATPEGEPDCGAASNGGDGTDTVNGGCSFAPFSLFSPIACGQSYCGTTGATGQFRDNDWHHFTVGVRRPIRAVLRPEWDSFIFLYATDGTCNNFVFLTSVFAPACFTSTLETCLDPGDYFVRIAPDRGFPAVNIPCGKEYNLALMCDDPADPAHLCVGSCQDTSDCTCTDDVWQGDCTGASEELVLGLSCCEVECRPPAATYDSLNMELLSHLPVNLFPSNSAEANDTWGFTSPRGRKYAILGLSEGTGFVDITFPRSPEIVADIPDSPSTWSDFKAYWPYVYNGNETGGGVQIINVSQIDPPARLVTLQGTLTQNGLDTTHTIAINPESGYLYLNGSNLGSGELVAVSLANPANPQIVAEVSDGFYVHDSQIVTYPAGFPGPFAGREIAFCFSGRDPLRIFDVTDKGNIVHLSDMPYPTHSYNHQGWITSDFRYVIFNDELEERDGLVANTTVYVADVQNLLAPFLAATFTHPTGCWIDHDLMVRGSRVYQAQYSAGLRVLDISNPLVPFETAYFDTHPEDNVLAFTGMWGSYAGFPTRVVIGSDMERGLYVLCDEPERPIAGFVMDANPADCNQLVAFDAASSTHCTALRSVVAYEWDFDYDGVAFSVDASGVAVSHAFSTEGKHSVALRVTDDDSPSHTDISVLTIDVVGCVPPNVIPDAAGGEKTRAISFTAPPSAVATGAVAPQTAIRVTSVDLQHPVPPNPPNRTQPNFTAFDTTLNNVCSGPGPLTGYYCQTGADCTGSGTCPAGVGCTEPAGSNAQGSCARWVGPPFKYLESRDSPGVGNYLAARVQCTPFYHNWGAEGLVHVLGSEIVPSSRYNVEAYSASCKGNEGSCPAVSNPVSIATRRAGDVFAPFNPPNNSPQPEGPDVAAVVNKFKNLPGSIVKAIAQVQSNFPIPTNDVDGTDIAVVVDAVKGFAYGFSGPCICPSTVPCDTTVCSTNGQCANAPGNYGAGAQCVRECQLGSPRVGEPCTESVGDPPIPDLDCGSCSAGSPNPGIPCDANSDCSPGTCATGVCGAGGPATTGFCRDRCGRCN